MEASIRGGEEDKGGIVVSVGMGSVESWALSRALSRGKAADGALTVFLDLVLGKLRLLPLTFSFMLIFSVSRSIECM